MPLWTALIPALSQLLDRIIPDPAARENAKLALTQAENTALLQQTQAMLQADAAQANVNQAEAGSRTLFVAGWRPFIGWVCGVAFAYHFVLLPLLAYILAACGKSVPLPAFDMQELSTVLMGMLGLGVLEQLKKSAALLNREDEAFL